MWSASENPVPAMLIMNNSSSQATLAAAGLSLHRLNFCHCAHVLNLSWWQDCCSVKNKRCLFGQSADPIQLTSGMTMLNPVIVFSHLGCVPRRQRLSLMEAYAISLQKPVPRILLLQSASSLTWMKTPLPHWLFTSWYSTKLLGTTLTWTAEYPGYWYLFIKWRTSSA